MYIHVCISTSTGHRIPLNLRRLSARLHVITRNFVRLKLASLVCNRGLEARAVSTLSKSLAACKKPRPRDEKPPRVRMHAYSFASTWNMCHRIAETCSQFAILLHISSSHVAIDKQKSDIELVIASIITYAFLVHLQYRVYAQILIIVTRDTKH